MAQPKKPRQKQIKLKDINEQYQKINSYKTHILDEKNNTVIKYLKVFGEDRIQALMKEAFEDSVYVRENGLELFEDENGNEDLKFVRYIYFLIIKHMTQLKDEIPDSFEDKIAIFNQIEAIGLFHELMENAFQPEEVSKVLERVGSFALLAQQMAEAEEKARAEMNEIVQHPLMKKKLSKDA